MKTSWLGSRGSRWRFAVCFVVACVPGAFSACAADGDGDSPGAAGADAGGSAGAPSEAGIPECKSGILCGTKGTCCDSGEECVGGACKAECASGVRCANVCCDAGDLCFGDVCETPGASCLDSVDCNANELCEPIVGKCVKVPTGVSLCEYKSPTLDFAPVVKWSWPKSPPSAKPTSVNIQSPPIIGDIDKDGVPDVIVITFATNVGPGYLRALDGKTGAEKWPASAGVFQAGNEVRPATTPAIGDIDNDGNIEIVVAGNTSGFMAFNADGSVKWEATEADGTTPWSPKVPWLASFSIARMDADDQAEIVLGGEAFDSKGRQITPGGYENAGMNGTIYGPDSLIADVDGDGVQDIVTGTIARKLAGALIYDNQQPDGYNAIADLDGDGVPEVIVTSLGTVRVQDAATGSVLATAAIPGGGTSGGPPTVADFDGDGVMDFAAAGSNNYVVFGYAAHKISVKWSSPTQDVTPGTTGSSVFDFDGDGAAEVIYNDECKLRVYNGKYGTVLWELPNSSLTGVDHPVAVDVDGDGHTELVATAADSCSQTTHGVFVYADPQDRWARTRRVWNQHTYHITNINADLSLPGPEIASWRPDKGGYNNYRVSAEGRNTAADLAVDLEALLSSCPSALVLRAKVKNVGSLGVKPGTDVTLYAGLDVTGTLLGTKQTTGALLPGGSEAVEFSVPTSQIVGVTDFFVVVDGSDAVHECDEQNNDSTIGAIMCPAIR